MLLEARAVVELTKQQRLILMLVTRIASTLSGAGVIAIIATFCFSRHFRNPMHRLIFINAFFNAFDVTCTMISVSGPESGNGTVLCQFQGFLNQMWVQATALMLSKVLFFILQEELVLTDSFQVPRC